MAAFLNFVKADGITNLVFPSLDDLVAFFNDPEHEKTLNPDVAEFADAATVTFAVGKELSVIQNGKLVRAAE